MSDFIGVLQMAGLDGATFIGFNCRVGRSYPRFCEPGNVCNPVEGSIATECGVKGCKKFM